MESSRASTIPTIGDSSEGNGFTAIVISDLSRRTLNSSTIRTTVTAASKARPLSSSFRNQDLPQFCHLENSGSPRSITSRREPSRSFVSSGATEIWIFLENISNFLKTLSTLMSEPKLLRHYIKFRSIPGKNSSCRCLINCPNGLPQTPPVSKRCIDTTLIQKRVNDVVAFTK